MKRSMYRIVLFHIQIPVGLVYLYLILRKLALNIDHRLFSIVYKFL